MAFVIMIVLVCFKGIARKVPHNYYLLLAFTIFEAITVGYICARVNNGVVVVTAAFMTASIVIALTLYAIFTKTDFTACGGSLTVIGWSFFMFGILCLFLGPTANLVYSIIGVVLFGIYLVFDTQLIVGGTRREYSISKEDYILGAMILYLDIINIFVFLLRILGSKK